MLSLKAHTSIQQYVLVLIERIKYVYWSFELKVVMTYILGRRGYYSLIGYKHSRVVGTRVPDNDQERP